MKFTGVSLTLALSLVLAACGRVGAVDDAGGAAGALNSTGGRGAGAGHGLGGEAAQAGSASAGGGGGEAPTGTGSGGEASGGQSAGPRPSGVSSCTEPEVCGLRSCVAVEQPASHVELCSALTPSTNPPSIGPHYGAWAEYGIYGQPIPDGFLMHSLEHGGVALLYDCARLEALGQSCSEARDALVGLYDDFPADERCAGYGVPHRLIVAPATDLPHAFGIAAWGRFLESDCFDADSFAGFAEAYYARGPEDICAPGTEQALVTCP